MNENRDPYTATTLSPTTTKRPHWRNKAKFSWRPL